MHCDEVGYSLSGALCEAIKMTHANGLYDGPMPPECDTGQINRGGKGAYWRVRRELSGN